MERKSYFISAAAITGVVLAGTTAVAANIGILNAADDDNVGNLTAAVATVPATVEPQIIDVYIEEAVPQATFSTRTPGEDSDSTSQEFKVDEAGTVTIKRTPDGILLDGATVNDGWDWTSNQSSATDLVVTFTSGDSEFVFYAGLADDGSIAARVDEPIVNVVQAPPAPSSSVATPSPAAPVPSYDDDDHYEEDDEYEEYEDHEDEEDDDHEGGDDDD